MIGAEPVLAPLAPLAPWGVQLAGNFSKQQALASYARAHQSYASIIGDLRPMVIGTRVRSREHGPTTVFVCRKRHALPLSSSVTGSAHVAAYVSCCQRKRRGHPDRS